MRADRLVAIVLLLQVHRKLTAGELAERLETSERTIRRDLEALMLAGVPIYPRRGRDGGWALVGGNRLDLTGLTSGEAQALFLATGAAAAGDFGPGVAEGLAGARRKVLAALPPPLRAQVEAAAAAIHVDGTRWGLPDDAPAAQGAAGGGSRGGRDGAEEQAHLEALRAAVLAGVRVRMAYEPPGRLCEERRLSPHGLVNKRGVWYLLAGAEAGLRTYRLSRVRSVEVLAERAERPDGFDLAQAWGEVQRRMAERPSLPVVVEVAVPAPSLRRVRAMIGAWWPMDEPEGSATPATLGAAQPTVTVRFPSAAVAAAELSRLGEHAEVLSPPEVRAELAAIGRRLEARYRD